MDSRISTYFVLKCFLREISKLIESRKVFCFPRMFSKPASCLYLCSSKSNFYFTVLMLYLDKSVTSPANNITNVWNISKVLLGFILENCDYLTFISIWVFFHEHLRFTMQQGQGEAISLTPLYHFHPHHRHVDISRAIAAKSSPLH